MVEAHGTAWYPSGVDFHLVVLPYPVEGREVGIEEVEGDVVVPEVAAVNERDAALERTDAVERHPGGEHLQARGGQPVLPVGVPADVHRLTVGGFGWLVQELVVPEP